MKALLPGSYDPVTNGHLEIIKKASNEYDEVYVVIFVNPEKQYTFSLDDRLSMLMVATDELPNVLVSYSPGMVIDYMREHSIDMIVKGYRNEADLEYERKQAEFNLKMGGFKTRLIKCEKDFEGISSTEARKRILEGSSLEGLLPDGVIKYIGELDRSKAKS